MPLARLPIAEMAAQSGPAAMREALAAGHARASVILSVLMPVLVKTTAMLGKIAPGRAASGKVAVESATAETLRHPARGHSTRSHSARPHSAMSTTKAAAVATTSARASFDLGEDEPKYDGSTDSESFSKKHPGSSCNAWTPLRLLLFGWPKSSGRTIK
jgi:hypothetical protein